MIDSLQSVLDALLKFFEDHPSVSTLFIVPLPFMVLSKVLTFLIGYPYSLGLVDVLAELIRWIFGKFVDLLCSFEFGFKLAYKFGWAKPGVHFFDCGIHCSSCPKFSSCTSEFKDEGGRLDV